MVGQDTIDHIFNILAVYTGKRVKAFRQEGCGSESEDGDGYNDAVAPWRYLGLDVL